MGENLSKFALILEYDGTNYCGFQFQENAPTVQEEIEKALLRLTGEQIRVRAASRTDTGVHAKEQVISFRTGLVLKAETYIKGLNHFLPADIAVKASYKVNAQFHVQLDAVSREYRYLILNSSTPSALRRGYSYHVGNSLDVESMDKAAHALIGEHDLASFITHYSQSIIKSSLRKVFNARVTREEEMVVFEITAKSFLPHQVRNTVGTLIKIGKGKLNISDFQSIMEAKKPGLAGPTVPAQGLYLMKVNYPRPLGDYDEDL